MARKQIGLALDPGLLGRVDAARGMVPRAAWIAGALEAALGADAERAKRNANGVYLAEDLVREASSAVEEASEEEARRSAAASAQSGPAPTSHSPASPRRPPSIAETWAR